MSNDTMPTAPGRVPDEFIYAEIATFPLVSEQAFRVGLRTLDPKLTPGQATEELWRACEAHVSQHCNWSLDRIVSTRDHLWFEDNSKDRGKVMPLAAYLQRLAGTVLEPTPGRTRLTGADGGSTIDAGNRARWLSFSFPEDLLLSGLGIEPAPLMIESDAPLLTRRLLDLGVAEIHQHLGASMNFSLLWVSALAALAVDDAVGEEAMAGPGAPFSEGKTMTRWLLTAAIVRCLLAEYLARLQEQRISPPFAGFVAKLVAEDSTLLPRARRFLLRAVRALLTGDDEKLPSFLDLRDLYVDLHPLAGSLRDRPLTSIADAYRRCDPICARVELAGSNAGERWLQWRALRHLRLGLEADRGGHLFERLWWQLVRVRCQYYRSIVERPLNSGLQWFIRFYDRIGKLCGPLTPILVEASHANIGEGVTALEVRTGLPDSRTAMAERLLTMLRSWKRVLAQGHGHVPEFGVVLHFIKLRDVANSHAWTRGAPQAHGAQTNAEPLVLGHAGARYLDYFNDQASRARVLAELLEGTPSLLWLLRGLDITSDELAAPSWVFTPLFAYLGAVADVASQRPGGGPPLRFTGHVGEDFRHLLEGMRHIYQQVHYLLGSRGGRIGHGIALGIDPRRWAESAGLVAMPLEDRLWDLVFEWRLHTRYHAASDFATVAPAGRIERLENWIREYSEVIYEQALEPRLLVEVDDCLHRFLVPEPGQPWRSLRGGLSVFANQLRRSPENPPVRDWVKKHLTDHAVFVRGQRPIDVRVDAQEVAALIAVQNGMRSGLARRSIVVEVNPSSNLLIGDLGDLQNHPILRLFPPTPREGDPAPIAIAVGSDDPVTFSTSLLHEYVLLHQSARAAGYSERAVQQWLEAIRGTGMDARMTVAWRPRPLELAEQIERELERTLALPKHARARRSRSARGSV